jgi:hypothetical protein
MGHRLPPLEEVAVEEEEEVLFGNDLAALLFRF